MIIITQTHEWELDEENSRIRLLEVHTPPRFPLFMDRNGVPWCYQVQDFVDGWATYASVTYDLLEPLRVTWLDGYGMNTSPIQTIT
jgi:hypothetical protein